MRSVNYLVQVKPWDPASGELVPLYFAMRAHETDSADTPPSKLYQGVLLGFEIERAAVRPDGALGGRSAPGSGSMTIAIPQSWKDNGRLEALLSYVWDGRSWEIRKVVAPGDPWSTASIVGAGTISDVSQSSPDHLDILFHDRALDFQKTMQTDFYGGTGGFDGTAELAGKPRPLVFGYEANAPGVVVDPVSRHVDFHAGPVEEILEVRDRGAVLTKAASSPPAAGQWYPDLTNGRVQLGSDPTGEVTATIMGATAGGVWLRRAGEVAAYLAETYGGLAAGEIDTASVSALDASRTGAVAISTGTAPVDLSAVLDRLLSPLGWWGFTRAGQFRLGEISAATAAAKTDPAVVKVIRDYKIVKGSLRKRPRGIPPLRIEMQYGRHAVEQSADQLAGGLTMEKRQQWATPFLVATAPDPAGQAARAELHPRAVPLEVQSSLARTETGAAEDLAAALDGLIGVHRDFVELETEGVDGLDRGDEVWIEHADYKLDAPGVVLGVTEGHGVTGRVEVLI